MTGPLVELKVIDMGMLFAGHCQVGAGSDSIA